MKNIGGTQTKGVSDNVIELPIRMARSEAMRLVSMLGESISPEERVLPTDEACLIVARRMLSMHRARAQMLGDLCTDAPWVMLLDLYDALAKKSDISVSSVCIASLAPPTTALRYLSILVDQGLVQRIRPTHDARLVYVALTPMGNTTMTKLLCAML
jgi:hypothetical protein